MKADLLNWNRLEPSTRTDDQTAAVARGLEARVHDPLWLLGRQWQFREFEGEDAGSPVAVRAQFATTSLAGWVSGVSGGTAVPFAPDGQPLETMAEREAAPFVGLRASAEAGLHFLSLLAAAGHASLRAAYVAQYPLQPDAADVARDPTAGPLVALLVGRAPDGVKLAADLKQALPALPAAPVVPAADADGVLAVATAWLAWYAAEVAAVNPTDTWVPERLEYRFSVSAPSPTGAGEAVLAAPDYRGDGLDWYDFVHQPGTTLGVPAAAPTTQVWSGLPAPVTFRGMPAQRWWEFEDAAVDLGAVDTAPEDLARLILTEFATVYGNDWYVIPVNLPLGSLTSVTSLVVTDSFGQRLLIEPTARARTQGGPWRMYQVSEATLTRGSAGLEALFLPPVVATQIDGKPLEEVQFFRDEMADQAWGVEHVVQGVSGSPLNRVEEWQRSLAAVPVASPAAPIAPLRYQLATSVPDHWIPLIPVHDGTPRGIRLERGAMLHFDGATATAIEPRGRVLNAATPLRFYDEEIPREGRRVRRVPVVCRWVGGTTLAWVAHRNSVGRGEGSSGLKFDLANAT